MFNDSLATIRFFSSYAESDKEKSKRQDERWEIYSKSNPTL